MSIVQFSGTLRNLPRAFSAAGPRISGMGFAVASVHEGPPVAVTDEERCLARTMQQPRRSDFLIGRSALHRAVRAAGLTAGPVLCDGPRPRLPEGLSASISHSRGVAVAVAGPADRFPVLGVDLELADLPLRAAHLVLREPERPLLGPPRTAPQRLLALYSAKEAAFKALSPVLGPHLRGLRDVRLTPDGAGFLAQAGRHPGPRVRVSVRHLPAGGVLCWALPHAQGVSVPAR
ncbi:4'-phosphopantetheinyl transferase superfamily protein [Streptomyces sp. FXJ1.172]|uniref:4'-phosphopantetheinyl transferase superfamily protein n=1 Tax=Streptomyces sp. FXJ1.172 TaxID=710705 RepID=UPI000A88B226|nr:4'-phosphopantetheinyl transferase superfamily protein [Streptomyces sp. FXJ1.172]WEO94228.1 4'-phosphopantetheinyl transferase superfamily protein [Streptomyces sp. FXJ1.172]